MNDSPSLYALILAGGSGTRFWPASRQARPKQFLPLAGSEPLLVQTVQRARTMTCAGSELPMERVLIATGRHLEQGTRALLPELPPQNMLAEPAARNTAPCIAWAAMRIARRDPEALFMVLPSDQFIADEHRFRRVLETALAEAANGTITTVGIHPTHPETGYGYIRVEADDRLMLPKSNTLPPQAFRAQGFVEKPDRATALEFLRSGHYFWNAGMFFFRVKDMLDAVLRLQPALYEGLSRIEDAYAKDLEQGSRALEEIFPTLPSVSIDKGIMEHIGTLSVVPGDFGWSDLGSWHSAWEFAQKDAQQNALPPSSVAIGSQRNLVVDLREKKDCEGKARVIALVGVNDVVVVETDDALLVVSRAQAQHVKDVVEWLKEQGLKDKL